MDSTHDRPRLQAHLDEFFGRIANSPELCEQLSPEDLPQLLEAGLSHVLNNTLKTERQFHLQAHPEDRANGYAPKRTLNIGATTVALDRPRTRQGFYPAVLPKHQRHLPQAYQQLLRNILLGARSFNAARRTLQALGLGYSPEQVEQLLQELHEEAKNFFTRPLGPDWLCLFIDAKLIELKDEHDVVKQAVHFLVVGIGLDGKKDILTATSFWGNEVLEAWRKVLIDLKNRGLVRVLLLVTDDFSGLAPLVKGLFPNSDHQLCTVHLLRNAQRHLSLEDYTTFKQTWREIHAASSFESAQTKFRTLLQELRPANKAWVEHLEKRVANYLSFIKYPTPVRPHLRSTNLPEGINNQIENLRRNAGGHFHSEREALIKMKLLTNDLYDHRWSRGCPTLLTHLGTLNQMFRHHFELELNPEIFLTQNF
ncbi:MAG TPA: IS256 family transposase [Candidatus Acidoferrum sp.]|jgi:putative transposase|nr:IS256 family transposase [Candidatus Acidoferrum sp.]